MDSQSILNLMKDEIFRMVQTELTSLVKTELEQRKAEITLTILDQHEQQNIVIPKPHKDEQIDPNPETQELSKQELINHVNSKLEAMSQNIECWPRVERIQKHLDEKFSDIFIQIS